MKNKKTLKVKNWKSSLFFILFFIFIITSQEALAGDFYTVDAKNPTIRKIDSTTLNTTETITVSVDGEQVNGFNGASVDTGTGDVYVVLSLDGYSDRHLAIVEMGTGDMTLVGSLGDKFAAIAFDAVGQLYGLTGDGADTPASLYSINKNTAEKTLLASYTASSDGEVLAFNNDDSFFYRATGDDLYAIDVNDPTNLITVLEDDSSLPGPEGLFHRENDSFYYIDWDELLDLDSTSGATFINDLDVGTKGMFEWPIDIGPAPSIYYPKDEDFNVPADSNFSITFDREVYAGIGNVEVRILSDDSVIESIDITSDQIVGWGTEEITIDPINILPADTSVYINIDSGAIKDGDDLIYGGISNSSTWSFTTISNGDDFVFEEIFNLNDFVDYDEMNVDIINEEGIVKLSASQLWDPYNVSSILSNEANESMRVVLDSL